MKTIILCSIFLAAIAGAELTATLVGTLWGIIFYFVILFLILISSASVHELSCKYLLINPGSASQIRYRVLDNTVVAEHPSNRLFLALGLAPLIRILSLAMPLAQFSQIYWYLIISVPVFVGILAIIASLNLQPKEIGLTTGSIRVQGLVALTGIVLGLVDYFILRPEPLILFLTWQEVLVPAIILLVATGFVEELAFRGVIQRTSMGILGPWGWIYVAVLYSVLQIGQRSAVHCLFALFVALFFGWIVKRTGSLFGVSLSHGLINIGLYLIFPFVF